MEIAWGRETKLTLTISVPGPGNRTLGLIWGEQLIQRLFRGKLLKTSSIGSEWGLMSPSSVPKHHPPRPGEAVSLDPQTQGWAEYYPLQTVRP